AKKRGYSTWISGGDEVEFDGKVEIEESTCYCTKQMVPTEEAIAKAQQELEELSAPFGGRVDDWSLERP
ncbi:MAG: ribonuclease E inhibitor RraB, partial [Polyangiaceae bacterium]|nr:ribonuclease E inhibitor RraB [Polyangiaceae bacterium]